MRFRPAIFAVSLLAVLLATAAPVMAKPTAVTVPTKFTQWQWRAYPASPGPGGPFGAWSFNNQYAEDVEYTLTGNVLHGIWTYQPYVSNEEGSSTVYTYDKTSGLWIEHEGTVTYNYAPRYGEYTVTNYFRGYLDFDKKAPSSGNFVHGVAYQWVYIYAPQDDTGVQAILPNATWDQTMGAWLVGFSIYYMDPVTKSYTPTFPSPFIEPVPAGNYNPLGL